MLKLPHAYFELNNTGAEKCDLYILSIYSGLYSKQIISVNQFRPNFLHAKNLQIILQDQLPHIFNVFISR